MPDNPPAVRFTRHARNRMRLWKIAEATVLDTLTDPDHTTPDRKSRLNAWKREPKRWIKVTYVLEKAVLFVVTVTPLPPRKGPRRR